LKNVVFIFIAAIIIGFVCFALFYWLMNFSFIDARILGISAAFSGAVVEFIKLYRKKRGAEEQLS
jgi:hypothetical protein